MNINTLIKKLQKFQKEGVKQVFFQDYCWNPLVVEFQLLNDEQLCAVISEDLMDGGNE
jgi:hypothetical protein